MAESVKQCLVRARVGVRGKCVDVDKVGEYCSMVVFDDASERPTLTRRTLHRRGGKGHLR